VLSVLARTTPWFWPLPRPSACLQPPDGIGEMNSGDQIGADSSCDSQVLYHAAITEDYSA
jgi:hypothetical protein